MWSITLKIYLQLRKCHIELILPLYLCLYLSVCLSVCVPLKFFKYILEHTEIKILILTVRGEIIFIVIFKSLLQMQNCMTNSEQL